MIACRFLAVSSVLFLKQSACLPAYLLTCLSPGLLPESMQRAFRRLIHSTDITLARPKAALSQSCQGGPGWSVDLQAGAI